MKIEQNIVVDLVGLKIENDSYLFEFKYDSDVFNSDDKIIEVLVDNVSDNDNYLIGCYRNGEYEQLDVNPRDIMMTNILFGKRLAGLVEPMSEYLKELKYPPMLLDSYEDDIVAELIIEYIEEGAVARYGGAPMTCKTSWSYQNGTMRLSNNGFEKERDFKILDVASLHNFIMEFNTEWNSYILGRFDWK